VETLSRLSLKPYRVEEGIAHFDVSKAGFDDFATQVEDAVAFLRSRAADVKLMMSESGAIGVLDFGVEWRDVAAQFDTFPAELVREAGGFGLALELSHYPVSEGRGAEA
jgi:hypothetical protein